MEEAHFKRKTKQTKHGLRCKKHPGYAVKRPPQYNKAYPTGCPVCITLWEKFAPEEPEVVEVEVVEDGNGKDTKFKEGPANPKWKQKVDPDDPINKIIDKYTNGGERIISEIARIAGTHPTHTLNYKGVNYKDKFQANKWLAERKWGPAVDPYSDKVVGNQILIVSPGEVNFVDYKKGVVKELEGPK